jgi:hypothetical protein
VVKHLKREVKVYEDDHVSIHKIGNRHLAIHSRDTSNTLQFEMVAYSRAKNCYNSAGIVEELPYITDIGIKLNDKEIVTFEGALL